MKPILTILFILFMAISYGQNKVCSIKSSPAKKLTDKYTLYSTSSNPQIDMQTVNELRFLNQCFAAVPNFFFYDDNDGKNSKASDEVTRPDCPDGTIIFGKRLFNSQYLKNNGTTAIPIMIAHEYAHIADFKYGALQHVSNKKKELFADYLAGIYMSLRIRFMGFVDINAAHETFEELGDTDFGDVDKHGSSEERVDALMAGYNKAEEYIINGQIQQLTLRQAIKEAKDYLDFYVDDEEDEDVIDPE